MWFCKYILGASATVLLTYLAPGCFLQAGKAEPAISEHGNSRVQGRGTDSQSRRLGEKDQKHVEHTAQIRDRGSEHDLRRQIVVLRESARQAQHHGLSQIAATSFLRIGELHNVLSEYGPAATAYLQSLRLSSSNISLRCSARSHLARLHAAVGNKGKAAEYSRQIQKLCSVLPDRRTVAETLEATGESLYYSNEPDGPEKALVLLLQAKSIYEETADFEGQGLASLYAAYAASQKGDTQQALAYAEEALSKW